MSESAYNDMQAAIKSKHAKAEPSKTRYVWELKEVEKAVGYALGLTDYDMARGAFAEAWAAFHGSPETLLAAGLLGESLPISFYESKEVPNV